MRPIHVVVLLLAGALGGALIMRVVHPEKPPAPVTIPETPKPSPMPRPAPPVSAEPVPQQPHQVTLNAGFVLPVRLVDGLSSERNAAGDAFAATLDREVVADGFLIAARGARVELTVLHTADGQTVEIQTDGFFQHSADLTSETLMAFRLKNPLPLTERLH